MATAKTTSADIDIVNIALSLMGVDTIGDFDDTTNLKASNLATATYDNLLRLVMSSYPWGHFTEFEQITAGVLSADVYDYESAFDIPGGTLRVWAVENQTSQDGDEWIISGNQILTNLGDEDGKIKAQLIKYKSDVGAYPPYFIDAVVGKLISEWTQPLIHKTSETEMRKMDFKDKVRDATSSDGGMGSPVRTETYATSVINRT